MVLFVVDSTIFSTIQALLATLGQVLFSLLYQQFWLPCNPPNNLSSAYYSLCFPWLLDSSSLFWLCLHLFSPSLVAWVSPPSSTSFSGACLMACHKQDSCFWHHLSYLRWITSSSYRFPWKFPVVFQFLYESGFLFSPSISNVLVILPEWIGTRFMIIGKGYCVLNPGSLCVLMHHDSPVTSYYFTWAPDPGSLLQYIW